ncbi:hypothetical protein NDQ71_00940 [Pseudoalteromonas sp. KG3]|uniref:hypothetical protein n=1 Tax=Pseudoalteromonas sp. KG3 TaxID=2951137 RepID=UPI002658477E|nr:hypothetical protein [Pseudoalteromonas sp. KG3]WKD23699.1 hypothetical protein NDQ71_00940 [Pseudoalteromonas sp. KG3]
MKDPNSELKIAWTQTFKETITDTTNALAALIISILVVTLQLKGIINLPTLVINLLYGLIFISSIRVLGQLLRSVFIPVKSKYELINKEKIKQQESINLLSKLREELHNLNIVQLHWLESLRYSTHIECCTDHSDICNLKKSGFIDFEQYKLAFRLKLTPEGKKVLEESWKEWDKICESAISLFFQDLKHKKLGDFISYFSKTGEGNINSYNPEHRPIYTYMVKYNNSILFDAHTHKDGFSIYLI